MNAAPEENNSTTYSIPPQNLYTENPRNTYSANTLVTASPLDMKKSQPSSSKSSYYSNNSYQTQQGSAEKSGYSQFQSPPQQQQTQFQPYQPQNTYQSPQTYPKQQYQQPWQSYQPQQLYQQASQPQQKPYQQLSQSQSAQKFNQASEISNPIHRKITPSGDPDSSDPYGAQHDQRGFGTANTSSAKTLYRPYSNEKAAYPIYSAQPDQKSTGTDSSKDRKTDSSRSKNNRNVVVIVEKEDADAEDELKLQEKLENKKKELENLDKLLTTFKQKTDQLQSTTLIGSPVGSTNILSPSFKGTNYLSSNPRSYASPPSLRQSQGSELTKQNVDQIRNYGTELPLENAKIICTQ